MKQPATRKKKPGKGKRKQQPPGTQQIEQMTGRRSRRFKIRHLIFLLVLLSGSIPLIVFSNLVIQQAGELLKGKETELLFHRAQGFADSVSENLAYRKDQLRQLGVGLMAPEYSTVEEMMASDLAAAYLRRFSEDHPELKALHVWNQDQNGREVKNELPVNETISAAYMETIKAAVPAGEPIYRSLRLSLEDDIAVAVAVPIPADNNETLVVSAVVPQSLEEALEGSDQDTTTQEVFLIDNTGTLLWSPSKGARQGVELALLESKLVEDFVTFPLSLSTEIDVAVGGKKESILARVVQVQETGWGVVVHKPLDSLYSDVKSMAVNAIIASVALVTVAFIFAVFASRAFSRPIQRLVQASHEIAVGNFDRRVETAGLGLEIADLGDDFNRMAAYVEGYIEQLRKAAEANRELFISTIRSFAATIDAKDPYTRGHSGRVAAYSRAIAKYLGLPKDQQEKVWIAAVLHDVGKIGIEDRILKKVGVLTPEEFEQMKLHPVIGAEIVEPIAALREMIPGIRWHHEAWNGTGYPDKLKGEQIPLMARIIGVADTFDAITTTRPYQNAYSTDYAIQTIKKLTGKKFDAKIVTAFLLAFEAGHIKVEKDEAEASEARLPALEATAGGV